MVNAILLSGSRATNMVTPFSDWDYLVFADELWQFASVRSLLWQRHWPKETHVNWGDEKTDEELFRSLCFSKLLYSRKNYYWEVLKRVYPDGVYPAYKAAQIMVAKGRLNNVYRFYEEENVRALRLITMNLAHQRAKMLNWQMPINKEDLISEIKSWEDKDTIFAFAEKCFEDISNCQTHFDIQPLIGYQRNMLRRTVGKQKNRYYLHLLKNTSVIYQKIKKEG